MIYTATTVLAVGVVMALSCRYYFPFRLRKSSRYPRILMYHATGLSGEPYEIPKRLNMPPHKLERHLRYLKRRGYTFLFASEVATAVGKRLVCLTFDDGYESNYEVLYPLLERYQAKATIFTSRATVFPKAPLLTESQMREMVSSGLVEFGAHTTHHVNLLQTSDAVATKEILDNRRWIESVTGKRCETFAYPFGKFSDRDVEILRRNGFKAAFTCERGIAPILDPLRLPRLYINGKLLPGEFHLLMTRGKFKI